MRLACVILKQDRGIRARRFQLEFGYDNFYIYYHDMHWTFTFNLIGSNREMLIKNCLLNWRKFNGCD